MWEFIQVHCFETQIESSYECYCETEQVYSRARHQSEENKYESTPVNTLEQSKENAFVRKGISYAVVTNGWFPLTHFQQKNSLKRELFQCDVLFDVFQSIRASGLILLEAIMFGALLLYFPVSFNDHSHFYYVLFTLGVLNDTFVTNILRLVLQLNVAIRRRMPF